jgi:hypothetical protein
LWLASGNSGIVIGPPKRHINHNSGYITPRRCRRESVDCPLKQRASARAGAIDGLLLADADLDYIAAMNFPLIFVYPFYVPCLVGPAQYYGELTELFRIGAKHPYVPDHIWEEITWW